MDMPNGPSGNGLSTGREIERRRLLQLAGLGVAGSAVFGSPLAAGAAELTADLVLHSGKVWTGQRLRPLTQAVAIVGQHIAAVGSDRDVMRWVGENTRVIDLRGAFVAPGFRDQHTHLLNQANTDASAASYRPSWTGHDEEAAIPRRRPIGESHINTFNQGRSPADNFAHGTVDEQLKESILRMQDEAARQGVTTVVEAGLTDLRVMDALLELAAEGRLKVRHLVRVRWGGIERAAQLGWTTGFGNEWVKILGVKMYADGWLGPPRWPAPRWSSRRLGVERERVVSVRERTVCPRWCAVGPLSRPAA
jgi:hypothetical protein